MSVPIVRLILEVHSPFLILTIFWFLIAPRSDVLKSVYVIVPGIDDFPALLFPNRPTTPVSLLKLI